MAAPTPKFLPYGRQHIDDDDIAAVSAALKGDFLTTGPLVHQFEAALAERTGAKFAVSCSNGTAALHIGALAAGLGSDDCVIVPSLTFLATANCARFVGAEVVFADVDPDTGFMTPETLEAAITRVPAGQHLAAAFPVHLRGMVCDMDGLADVARRHGFSLIEDAAHAIGSRGLIAGRMWPVGSCQQSVMACFSFHPVKTIAMGEGGAVTTNDPDLADRLRRMRSHGMVSEPGRWTDQALGFADGAANPWYYEMAEPGFNYRVTDIQCALGLSQMAKLDRFVARRAALVARYDRLIGELGNPHIRGHVFDASKAAPGWHLYTARIDFDALGVPRGEVMRRLRDRGIGTQVHYIPVHRQPYYAQRYGVAELPGADRYYARALSLPLYPSLEDSDIDSVVDALAAAVGTARG